MSWLLLFKNELKLQYFDMRQYWFETVLSLVVICGLFVGLFYGIKSFAYEGQEGQSLDGLMFGFLLWTFATTAYSSITKTVIDDTQKGYIEQLFIAPKSFTKLLFVKVIVDIASGFMFLILVTYLVMWLTGNWLDIHFLKFFAALLLAAPSLVGLGLIVSGFALVFKRVDTLGQMLTLALMALVALEGLPFGPITLLPFTPGVSLARDWVLNGSPLQMYDVAIVTLNSALYLFVGSAIFKHFEQVAKRKNLIGQY
ncbi:ABC transporter permease [Aliiglaciecola sp.]|nr:ABC transporter permease [Aliiglaciecola sp.]